MHAHVEAAPFRRAKLGALWLMLTVATVGFAMLVGGFVSAETRWTPLGTAVLGFGVLAFVFLQFWFLGTGGRRAAPVGAPRPAGASAALDYSYTDSPKPAAADLALLAAANGLHGEGRSKESLVEFQLADEPQAPTRLNVPSAFSVESRIDAAPPEPDQAWRHRRAPRIADSPSYIPAVERRQEIVSGLPLISNILTDEPPEAVQVQEERPGKTRGQCSSCGTLLWAPKTRPLRLRCPKCGHVRTLTS